MKTITITIPTSDPNVIGEWLRDKFFDQTQGGRGCYSTFTLNDNVQPLPDEPVDMYWLEDVEESEKEFWTVAETWITGIGCVKMRCYWDGDGTLEFIFDDEAAVVTSDCKKTNRWEWEKLENESTGN